MRRMLPKATKAAAASAASTQAIDSMELTPEARQQLQLLPPDIPYGLISLFDGTGSTYPTVAEVTGRHLFLNSGGDGSQDQVCGGR